MACERVARVLEGDYHSTEGTSLMPITITLRQLLDAQPALQRLSSEKLPIKLAYNVARLIRVLQPELDDFFKQRNELVLRYGYTRPSTEEERAAGQGDEVTEVPKDKMVEFRETIDDVVNEKITIDREPLKLDGFPNTSVADILALGPFLAEEPDEPPAPPAPPLAQPRPVPSR